MPWLAQARSGSFSLSDEGLLSVRWPLGENAALHLLAQLGDASAAAPALPSGETLYDSHAAAGRMRPPWSVRVLLEHS